VRIENLWQPWEISREKTKQNKTKTIRNRCGCVSRTRGRQRPPLEKEKPGERKLMFLTNSTLKPHPTTTAPMKPPCLYGHVLLPE